LGCMRMKRISAATSPSLSANIEGGHEKSGRPSWPDALADRGGELLVGCPRRDSVNWGRQCASPRLVEHQLAAQLRRDSWCNPAPRLPRCIGKKRRTGLCQSLGLGHQCARRGSGPRRRKRPRSPAVARPARPPRRGPSTQESLHCPSPSSLRMSLSAGPGRPQSRRGRSPRAARRARMRIDQKRARRAMCR
jgi:hypothetical protein